MAGTNSEGTGEAQNAGTAATPNDGEETAEEHQAAIDAKLREEADALIASAETAVEKAEAHLAGAKESLKDAKANKASLKE
jgi:hypothetical protein